MSLARDISMLPRHLALVERMLVYGFTGLCVEVMFTAIYEQVLGEGDLRLMGQTYLWMHPIWAFGLMTVDQGAPRMQRAGWPWWLRGLAWMLGSYTIEYSTGWILRAAVGQAPWDYSHLAGSIHGLICLEYAPGWFLCGLVAEQLTGLVRRVEIKRHPPLEPSLLALPSPPTSTQSAAPAVPLTPSGRQDE